MTYLLDVNVLIALLDSAHAYHGPAHEWFGREGQSSFATCPLTENGVLRIVGNPRYPKSPGTPAAVAASLISLTQHPGHGFWTDDVSLLDPHVVETDKLLDWSQLTDLYLVALAVCRGGRLATFDRKIRPQAVAGGVEALHLIV